jgi:AraC family transcriptional regulator
MTQTTPDTPPDPSDALARRIARALDAMHADPDRIWRLADLAEIACYSPFHFHRVYRAAMGETPDDTLRRLRLHRAAVELIEASSDIARIAQRAGYGSAAAFTRAFSGAYGSPPAAYRRRRGETRSFSRRMEIDMYEVTIGVEPARRLAGLPHRGDYQLIGAAFEKLFPLAQAQGVSPSGPMVGVYFDDPSTVAKSELRSFAAIETTSPVRAPLETMELASGPVASLVHKGPYAELPAAYDHLYCGWLPTSGREPADAPAYEIYLNDPSQVAPSELLTRVVMPLKA